MAEGFHLIMSATESMNFFEVKLEDPPEDETIAAGNSKFAYLSHHFDYFNLKCFLISILDMQMNPGTVKLIEAADKSAYFPCDTGIIKSETLQVKNLQYYSF
jgi:hypothetical protein